MERQTRSKDRLDYKVFHETGNRVVIVGGERSKNKMDTDEKINEMKIVSDINYNLEIYDLVNLISVEDIEEGLTIMSDLGQKFRHIHVVLENKLGDAYKTQYTEYEKILLCVSEFIKSAKSKLRGVKQELGKSAIGSAYDKDKEAAKIEEEFLSLKINQLQSSVDVTTAKNVYEIDDYINKIEKFSDDYFNVSGKLKLYFEDMYDEVYGKKFLKVISNMSDDVKLAKMLKQKILDFEKTSERDSREKFEQSVHITGATNLNNEIALRIKSLRYKFDKDLETLSDYQVLEISQDKNLDIEFNDLLAKVTSLAALAPVGGEPVEKLLTKVNTERDDLASLRDKFLNNLQKTVIERDITPDKMKHASGLKIELPKFSGYDCKIDFYTFRSQFKKLVEPTVQKKYWCDYLKRNYLCGSALILVEKETEYSKIWARLLESFGNARLLLQNKLSDLDKVGGLWKIKGDEKIKNAIAGLMNAMSDLKALASEHGIEGQLYEGGGLEKILTLIGDDRHRKFICHNLGPSISKKDDWEKLVQFLKKELLVRERFAMNNKTVQLMGLSANRGDSHKSGANKIDGSSKYSEANHVQANDEICHVCDRSGHTHIITARGNKIIPYYVCDIFVNMSPSDRLGRLKAKNLCTGCLYPGAIVGPKHKCAYTNFCCPHASHKGVENLHILLCEKHKKDDKNIKLLEMFKTRFVDNCKVQLPQCSKKLSFFSVVNTSVAEGSDSDVCENAIFKLQTIEINGVKLNLFFDDGCSEMVVRKSAVTKLKSIGRAVQIIPGPLLLKGVGDQKSVSDDGVYSISIPLYNGKDAKLVGLCLPKVTTEFPLYNLGEVECDIQSECREVGGQTLVSQLPRVASQVGGPTDILIGIKYNKYHPKEIFECETGLGIYKSVFQSPCGSRGVVGGPHREFTEVDKSKGAHVSGLVYVSATREYMKFLELQNNVPLLGVKVPPNDQICCACNRSPKCVKRFDEVEKSGTEISYRCPKCRVCPECKNSERIEDISFQEEIEQRLIERCVDVDLGQGVTTAKLPFIADPDVRLKDNESVAYKVLRAQIKKLSSKPEDRLAVLESEGKLQSLGFVEYFDKLSDDEKKLILSSLVRYFIPWRASWNEKSLSTPCRLVFDGSQGTKESCGINSLLAKGINSLNKLVEILIRWTVYQYAFHTDIHKMYNTIRLDSRYWRYQLYLWVDGLKEDAKPVWKVIKTLIYGIRSSGNLAEHGLRRTVALGRDEFPRAFDVITHDTYMDDTLSGAESLEEVMQVTDEVEVSVGRGGFRLKGFTISGQDPAENLSSDGESVIVAGLRWFPRGDFLKFNVGDLNFNRKLRGRKSDGNVGIIPDDLSKRHCVSKLSEIFDPLGRLAPLLGAMKLDVSVLHQMKLAWDDPIPAELRNIWVANFNLMKEIGNITFNRAIVPKDAISLDLETIDTADAGVGLVCAAIYARFKRRNGEYSCQLIFARTKVVHDISIPRAELIAAVLNASTGHVVRLSLKKFHKRAWKLTDSQVVMYWINNTKSALKMWVRNRVAEINRLVDRTDWYYVRSENMIADLGTRKGARIEDVIPGSCWVEGFPWMSGEESSFPIETVDQLVLSSRERSEANKESVLEVDPGSYESVGYVIKYVPDEVGERFKFSKYIINPCRFRFRTVVRILGLVFVFIQKMNDKCRQTRQFNFLKKRQFGFPNQGGGEYSVSQVQTSENVNVGVVHLTEDILNASRNYFFRKAALEIKHFVDKGKYVDKSVWKDEILYFTGRILPMQEIAHEPSLGNVSLDLAATTFCVPMVDNRSPIAYAIVSDVHWYDPDVNHGGVESVLRYSQSTAYIIEGRALVKSMKISCAQCRILQKKSVRVAMGPVGENNLKIAPPFNLCQVDLCGPFSAYSPANKRATLKIWLVVFCCTVTGAVDTRVMENYSTDAFISAFVRFSCRFGYPGTVMPDEGSQLVKGCQDMILSFASIQHKMSVEYGTNFKVCPVGAHYIHGKVERKIRSIKESIVKNVGKNRLSVLQWETLGLVISNSINNMPIGLGNKSELLEGLDILTPNRLILGRNNNRNPTSPLEISHDYRKIIESNNQIFESWFKQWLISYVPILIEKPKWFITERNICTGDVVLFLKSEKEFDRQYQYGLVTKTIVGRDGNVRVVEVEYQNHNEKTKRLTKRGVRELVVILPIDEMGIPNEIENLAGDP